jgi:hypothetical protein
MSSQPQENVRKIGEGHAQAMLRQGLKELQAAVYPDSNVAREAEVGTFGHPGQGEIAADRRPDAQPSILDKHAGDARAYAESQARTARDRGGSESPSKEPSEPERE